MTSRLLSHPPPPPFSSQNHHPLPPFLFSSQNHHHPLPPLIWFHASKNPSPLSFAHNHHHPPPFSFPDPGPEPAKKESPLVVICLLGLYLIVDLALKAKELAATLPFPLAQAFAEDLRWVWVVRSSLILTFMKDGYSFMKDVKGWMEEGKPKIFEHYVKKNGEEEVIKVGTVTVQYNLVGMEKVTEEEEEEAGMKKNETEEEEET